MCPQQLSPTCPALCMSCMQCINSDCWHVGAASDFSAKPNLPDRTAGNFRKAMGITAKEPDTAKRIPPDSETSHATAQSAANMVQIGFMAFAVSAYIGSSLCPDLQSYSPQPMRLTAPVRPCIAVNPAQCAAVLLKALQDATLCYATCFSHGCRYRDSV